MCNVPHLSYTTALRHVRELVKANHGARVLRAVQDLLVGVEEKRSDRGSFAVGKINLQGV
jgi:hypothetical protein